MRLLVLFSLFIYGAYGFLSVGWPGVRNTLFCRLWASAKQQGQYIKLQGNQPGTGGRKAKQKLKSDVTIQKPVISSMKKAWESGNAFADLSRKNTGNKKSGWLRNEPWWMREDESRNPRLLSKYQPWWSRKFKLVDPSLTLLQLKKEATFRGVSSVGKKADLLLRLQDEERLYSLSDDNFVAPTFSVNPVNEIGACYPEVYEKDAISTVDKT